jgi:hypothetical protein
MLLKMLREDLITFVSELSDILPTEPQFVLMKGFLEYVIIADVGDYIIRNLVPLESKVIAREQDYFMKHAVMFESLQRYASKVNHFKTLWENMEDEDDKLVVWEWLHHFIKLGKRLAQIQG